jgi:sigma-54 dependent transcriptional regulator, acetoin dehydrogenase operon transcriptional activator AcoR
MRQLNNLQWPGNLAPPRNVLSEKVTRHRSGVVGIDKLPPRVVRSPSLAARQLVEQERYELVEVVDPVAQRGHRHGVGEEGKNEHVDHG